jgi:SAM-dependent methyltransferase
MALLWRERREERDATRAAAADDLDVVIAVVRLRIAGVLQRMDRALEIGCGTGARARLLAPYFSEYLAVDPDEVAVGRARRESAGLQLDGLRFEVADGPPACPARRDFVLCDLARDGSRASFRARIEAVTADLAPGGVALLVLPRRRGPAWPVVADAARAQGGRIVWIDRSGASGRLYCISRS